MHVDENHFFIKLPKIMSITLQVTSFICNVIVNLKPGNFLHTNSNFSKEKCLLTVVGGCAGKLARMPQKNKQVCSSGFA
jgi:hypothetical protein